MNRIALWLMMLTDECSGRTSLGAFTAVSELIDGLGVFLEQVYPGQSNEQSSKEKH